MKQISSYGLFFSFISLFTGLAIWSISNVYKEYKIEQLLDSQGISTVGTIVKCNPGQKSTPVEFEYEVVDRQGNKIKYTTTNHGGGGTVSECKTGKAISIRYLPESPEIARHSGNINFSSYVLMTLCSLGIVIRITYEAVKHGIAPK